MAKKTSLCEKAFKTFQKQNNVTIENTYFATTSQKLGEIIVESLSSVNLVFIIGGLGGGNDSTEEILSNALSYNPPSEIRKLKASGSDYIGYLIRQDNQVIVAFPDNPKAITPMLDNSLNNYIQNYCFIN